jgi:hypothetical protein
MRLAADDPQTTRVLSAPQRLSATLRGETTANYHDSVVQSVSFAHRAHLASGGH